MSNAQFTPKVYQPIKEDGIITNWEWVEMVPGATNEIRGTVFISDFINNNEPNIFQTEEDCTSFTSVSPVGVRNALQKMALCKETDGGYYVVPENSGIRFSDGTELTSLKDCAQYEDSKTIIAQDSDNNGTKELHVKSNSLSANHLDSETGVIMVGTGNPNGQEIESSYKFFIQV